MRKREFDIIIKDNIAEVVGTNAFGYKVSGTNKEYDVYYSNCVFNDFIDEMKTSYQNAFGAYYFGKGSELKEHKGQYGMVPPKMASVASSSRFCYLALRDGAEALGYTEGVEFEHECKIDGIPGTAPQLDAYIREEDTFIEVKCHEILDHHSVVMKQKYWDLIYGDKNQFGFEVLTDAGGETFNIPLSAFEIYKDCTMFDIKQFLCHLLGIASHKGKSKRLVYLFFKPETDLNEKQQEINNMFYCLGDEINTIFNSAPIKRFCRLNNIKLMAVAEKSKTMEALTKENMITLYQD